MAETTKTAKTAKSMFEVLNSVNVNENKKQKNKLDYLSWAWAWTEVKKVCPTATSTVYENDMGWNYHTDGRTCWVKVGVTLDGLEHIEYLPVMDYKNMSIPLEKVTSMDVNKSIQRALTKAIARHGLGLYIYAGEDLPEDNEDTSAETQTSAKKGTKNKQAEDNPTDVNPNIICSDCGKEITDHLPNATRQMIIDGSMKKYKKPVCFDCIRNRMMAEQAKTEEDKNNA